MILLILALLLPVPVLGAEVCYNVDVSGWTQTQRTAIAALAVQLRHGAGESAPLTRWSNTTGEVCFDSPTVDLSSVLTPVNILAAYTAWQADLEAARIAEETRQMAFDSELSSNDLCVAELLQIATRIQTAHDNLDTAIQAVTSLAGAKTVLAQLNDAYWQVFAKIAKCVRARAR